jgi:hypothetical protein
MKLFMKKIQLLLATAAIFIAGVAVLAPVAGYADCAAPANETEQKACDATAAAAAKERRAAACEGAIAAGVTNCGNSKSATSDFKGIIGTVINILSVIVGAVSVIMIIIGGFRYVVSNGDSNAVSGAKNAILYAVVGLVVVLFAQIIVAFVIDRATS